jgi:hypothetical protein
MKYVHFKGVNYDPLILSKLASQGHRVFNIPTNKIVDLISDKSIGVKLAFEFEGNYHLLTGMLDKAQSVHEFIVISKYVLKKAAVEQTTHADRTSSAHQRVYEDNRRGQGFNSFIIPRR